MNFYPQNELTANLLRSIPKKILNWMTVLQIDVSTVGELGDVQWRFDVATQTNTLTESTLGITLTWLGAIDITDESEIFSNCQDLRDVVPDLRFIVQVEQAFFKPFEDLQDEMLDAIGDKHFDANRPWPVKHE